MWLLCLTDIRRNLTNEIAQVFEASPRAWDEPFLLVDPAFHENIGDNMLFAGELVLAQHLGWAESNVDICAGKQTMGRGENCTFKGLNHSLITFHAGGNWGDLYPLVHRQRLERVFRILKYGSQTTVLIFPQSMRYESTKKRQHDARGLNQAVRECSPRGCKLVLMWRQRDSYDDALRLYPHATNRLVPDVAFALGPYLDDVSWSIRPDERVDFLFLLRADKETAVASRWHQARMLRAELRKHELHLGRARPYTFRMVGWGEAVTDRSPFSDLRYQELDLAPRRHPYHKEQHVSFHASVRLNAARRMLATGTVLVTDRLHASIFAFLSFKPHVVLENAYGKVSGVRAVAFNTSRNCANNKALKFSFAQTMTSAIRLAVDLESRERLDAGDDDAGD